MRIDRCVCYGLLFETILERATEEEWTIEDIKTILGCGDACGMCVPYMKEMLRSGKIVFNEIIRDD